MKPVNIGKFLYHFDTPERVALNYNVIFVKYWNIASTLNWDLYSA